jgi:arylsulfatase A-like enzyme
MVSIKIFGGFSVIIPLKQIQIVLHFQRTEEHLIPRRLLIAMLKYKKLLTTCLLFFVLGGVICYFLCFTPAKPTLDRIVLVTIDTLRADHLGAYGYIRQTSPFFDQMARQGILFETHIASMSQTVPSHASLFTALYPLQNQVLKNGHYLSDDYVTLAESLKETGFTTAGFVSTGGHFRAGNLSQGFEYFFEPGIEKLTKEGRSYQLSGDTVQKAIDWLSKRAPEEKLFLWVHLFDPHLPLEPPQHHYQALLASPDQQAMHNFWTKKRQIPSDFFSDNEQMYKEITRYDAEIRYVDEQLKLLFDFYKQQGFDHNSLWILTSDHGEGLGSHYWWKHAKYIYNEQILLPLLFYFSSGFGKNQRIQALSENIDIFPTLMDLLGANYSRLNLQGKSFLNLLLPGEKQGEFKRYAFSQRRQFDHPPAQSTPPEQANYEAGETFCLQSLRYKYIHRTEGPDEFFNLLEDPYEVNNLWDQGLLEEKIFRQELLNIVTKLKKESSADYMMVDEEALEQLKSLGYAQ